MTAVAIRRVVVVTRRTELEGLLGRHATREQARFFLRTRGQNLDLVEHRHRGLQGALGAVSSAIPAEWRRTRVERGDVDRFLFEEDDIVVVVGQDGLVANVARYLAGQPVIGVDPAPGQNAGLLVRHPPDAVADVLRDVDRGCERVEARTMAEARTDDGQRLLALNEVFVGHRSHQSARYEIRHAERVEAQSSSGLIVATGTGATGWAASIHRQHHSGLRMPGPCDRALGFFVREPWPGPTTGTDVDEGRLGDEGELRVTSRMDAGGVVFADGIESDRLELPWGASVAIVVADRTLNLVRP